MSAKLQHYRLTLVVGPCDGDVSRLMALLAGRAPGGSILSGSCQTSLGGSYLGCRSIIGYATSVSGCCLSPCTLLSPECLLLQLVSCKQGSSGMFLDTCACCCELPGGSNGTSLSMGFSGWE